MLLSNFWLLACREASFDDLYRQLLNIRMSYIILVVFSIIAVMNYFHFTWIDDVNMIVYFMPYVSGLSLLHSLVNQMVNLSPEHRFHQSNGLIFLVPFYVGFLLLAQFRVFIAIIAILDVVLDFRQYFRYYVDKT